MLPLEDRIATLQELQVKRRRYTKAINKQTNALGGTVRRALGAHYVADADEAEIAERDKLAARAARIIGAYMNGKEQRAEDSNIAGVLMAEFEIVRAGVAPYASARHEVELQMCRIARTLPAFLWAKSVRGLGELAFAVIVAEAGDLSRYPDRDRPAKHGPAALWKRLGLAPYNGRAMSNWKSERGRMGDKALTSDEWSQLGYSPQRRAEIYSCVGDPLFRGQTAAKDGTRPAGPYRLVYDQRREHTAITHPLAPMVNGKNPPEPSWTKKHQHDDAVRVMTKHLLSDLWSEWRRAIGRVSEATMKDLSAAELFRMAAE
jgi:hypothetical protein